MMALIDTHFHLDKYKNHKALYEYINEKKQYTLCVTCNPGVFLSCIRMYAQTKYLRFGLGIHPAEIGNVDRQLYEFDHCLPQARYIGEVGLDYTLRSVNKEKQMRVFEHVIRKQAEAGLVSTIHVKGAEEDLVSCLKRVNSGKRIIHWYSGSIDCLKQLLDLGCYFSVNASMTTSLSKIDLLKTIPHNRILIESDGPYSKVSGKRYTPQMLSEAYLQISNALSIENLEDLVYSNFQTFLRL